MRYLDEDDYLSRQRQALAETLHHGQRKRSFQLAEHLAAEGGVHRSDILAVTTLFLAVHSVRAGDFEAAQRLAGELRSLDRSSVDLARQLFRLETGREQGWLPREHYDELLAYAWRENRPDLVAKVVALQPRDVPPAGWWADLERCLTALLV
ncbi:hypothetical protein [Amycolatopsis jejuensis]|uniref:hypothetical protein n=1 Tax=Amycolatopsis jejuensis TaxID=330084 RepID=UPI0005251472|nr:hypothetical protein [Amycolatopsis jejuensis]